MQHIHADNKGLFEVTKGRTEFVERAIFVCVVTPSERVGNELPP
jgi:hypothetical protein